MLKGGLYWVGNGKGLRAKEDGQLDTFGPHSPFADRRRAWQARKRGRKRQTIAARGWLDVVDKLGELERVPGASWDVEMGAITHMLTEKSRGQAPAILFDNVPGYPKGYRTLYGQLSSIKRIALTLGLPLEHDRKVDIVQRYHERMQPETARRASSTTGR